MKIIRRIIQWSVFLIFTAGFLPYSSDYINELTRAGVRLQFFPALLRISIIPLIIIASTFLLGRVYCSTLCPLATIQDLCAAGKKNFRYRRLGPLKRYLVPFLIMAALIAGFSAAASLPEPYSVSGRIISSINETVLIPIINLTALILRNFSVYITAYTFRFSLITAVISAASLSLLILMSRLGGRLFCNTLCPVGAILSIPARWAVYSHRIDAEKCVSCGACERVCKAEAIISASKLIDQSKCVSCFDCGSVCNFDALQFRRKTKPAYPSDETKEEKTFTRREFLTAGTMGSLLLISTPLIKGAGKNGEAALPPGARGISEYLSKCSACSLCISRCPGNVLWPASFGQHGIIGLGVPYMNFDQGACDYECNICTSLCPTGAINPLELEKKKRVKIGEAEFVRELCVVETDGTSCGACGEICPTGAIDMLYTGESPDGALEIPLITAEYCIGCGSCQFVCPVETKDAIFVKAFAEHKTAEVRSKKNALPKEETDNDFAF